MPPFNHSTNTAQTATTHWAIGETLRVQYTMSFEKLISMNIYLFMEHFDLNGLTCKRWVQSSITWMRQVIKQ